MEYHHFMKKLSYIIVLAISLMACQEKADYDIYLCIGQSNMAGRAPIEDLSNDTLQNVFLMTGNAEQLWEKAANPLNKYSTVRKSMRMQKVGPAYGFAKAMSAAHPDQELALVVNAKGGTSIRLWHPDSLLFQEAVKQAKVATQYGELKGIIWHQGCADARAWKTYMAKLDTMVSALRAELGADLPFVAGQLSYDKDLRIPFNKMIMTVPEHIPNASVVSSEGLSTIDHTHFDTRSQLILGQRYAEKMLMLQQNNK